MSIVWSSQNKGFEDCLGDRISIPASSRFNRPTWTISKPCRKSCWKLETQSNGLKIKARRRIWRLRWRIRRIKVKKMMFLLVRWRRRSRCKKNMLVTILVDGIRSNKEFESKHLIFSRIASFMPVCLRQFTWFLPARSCRQILARSVRAEFQNHAQKRDSKHSLSQHTCHFIQH